MALKNLLTVAFPAEPEARNMSQATKHEGRRVRECRIHRDTTSDLTSPQGDNNEDIGLQDRHTCSQRSGGSHCSVTALLQVGGSWAVEASPKGTSVRLNDTWLLTRVLHSDVSEKTETGPTVILKEHWQLWLSVFSKRVSEFSLSLKKVEASGRKRRVRTSTLTQSERLKIKTDTVKRSLWNKIFRSCQKVCSKSSSGNTKVQSVETILFLRKQAADHATVLGQYWKRLLWMKIE